MCFCITQCSDLTAGVYYLISMASDASIEILGAPVPHPEEFIFIYNELFGGFANSEGGIEELADKVMMLSPKIQRVIKHDVDQYLEYEVSSDTPDSQAELYADGIGAGYEFIVGCFSYTFFLRSGYDCLDDYLSDAVNRIGEIPVTTDAELQRVKYVRTQPTYEEYDDYVEPGRYADEVAADYFFEAPHVMDSINEYLSANPDKLDSYDRGYYHGVSHAIAMYIISKEEIVLSKMLPPEI